MATQELAPKPGSIEVASEALECCPKEAYQYLWGAMHNGYAMSWTRQRSNSSRSVLADWLHQRQPNSGLFSPFPEIYIRSNDKQLFFEFYESDTSSETGYTLAESSESPAGERVRVLRTGHQQLCDNGLKNYATVTIVEIGDMTVTVFGP